MHVNVLIVLLVFGNLDAKPRFFEFRYLIIDVMMSPTLQFYDSLNILPQEILFAK